MLKRKEEMSQAMLRSFLSFFLFKDYLVMFWFIARIVSDLNKSNRVEVFPFNR